LDSQQTRTPRILLLGKNGQVGADLYQLLGQSPNVLATDRSTLDLTCTDRIRECVRGFTPTIIINAAAYTAVDKAESECELATKINTTTPGVLAYEALRSQALLIHYSTDYVFDGKKSAPYVESDPVNPLNVYGKTKAHGEDLIRNSGCDHFIFRTSWVYSPRGSNFLLTILKLAHEREELRIVADQLGAPTASASIAGATMQAIEQWLARGERTNVSDGGTYHLTSSGYTSWFEFATEIVRQVGSRSLRLQRIIPIPSSDYPTAAQRPANSRLDCSKAANSLGISLPHWKASLSAVLGALHARMVATPPRSE
jgi:dTDP-4-dehydrorhamnose reductase